MESSTLNEKIYYKNDFSIKIRFNDNLFLIVASDMTQGLIYMNTLTNQNISEYSSLLFSKISDFSKFFIDNFESSPYIKFNKKEISIFVKIDFTHPIKKTISFSIPLKPQSGILFFRTLESEIETLNSRLKAIESKTENLNGFQNFASTLCKLDSLLSQITPKVHPKSFSDHPEEKRSYKKIKKNPAEEMQTKNDNFVSPVINTIENLDSSINGDPFNGMTDKILSEKKRNNGKLDFCFNSIHSLNFYEFSQDNKRITRTSIYKKQHFLCWGNFPLSKVCSQKFSIKIERISPESETINGTIGIMTSEVLGKINNLAEHSGIGKKINFLAVLFLYILGSILSFFTYYKFLW